MLRKHDWIAKQRVLLFEVKLYTQYVLDSISGWKSKKENHKPLVLNIAHTSLYISNKSLNP
jgi:hypothetical protein